MNEAGGRNLRICDVLKNSINASHLSNHRRRDSGAAMATVLMVMTLASILAFTLAATGLFHLNVCTRADNALQARNYAESGISRCLERVIADIYYGDVRNETIEIKDGARIVGELSFDPVQARRREMPFSTNNITNSASIYGCDNRLVPANSIHLVGKGSCNGVTRKMEAIAHVPSFPYCIATSGKLKTEGSLIVGSVASFDDIKSGDDDNWLLPGNIVSNSRALDAVLLNGKGVISGDLRTSGDVKIEKGSSINVKGEIRSHARAVAILPMDIQSYDPVSQDGVRHLPGFLHNPRLEGYCRVKNSLTVSGDVELNGSLLFVGGDLTVTGGIRGKGAVVVIGKTKMEKGAELTTDNLVALIAKGDAELGGSGASAHSAFQGIIYTEGNFIARNISVYGAFINNGTESSTVTFSDARMVNVSSYSRVDVDGPPTETVSFHYADEPSLPSFRYTVTKRGNDITYTLVDPNDNSKKVFTSRSEMIRYLMDWWTYCEDHGLYGSRYQHSDNSWDYDQVPPYDPGMDPQSVFNRIDASLTAKLDHEKLDKPVKIFSLNTNEFVGIKDRMRIVLWKEL